MEPAALLSPSTSTLAARILKQTRELIGIGWPAGMREEPGWLALRANGIRVTPDHPEAVYLTLIGAFVYSVNAADCGILATLMAARAIQQSLGLELSTHPVAAVHAIDLWIKQRDRTRAEIIAAVDRAIEILKQAKSPAESAPLTLSWSTSERN